jgi:hypothetical protein
MTWPFPNFWGSSEHAEKKALAEGNSQPTSRKIVSPKTSSSKATSSRASPSTTESSKTASKKKKPQISTGQENVPAAEPSTTWPTFQLTDNPVFRYFKRVWHCIMQIDVPEDSPCDSSSSESKQPEKTGGEDDIEYETFVARWGGRKRTTRTVETPTASKQPKKKPRRKSHLN